MGFRMNNIILNPINTEGRARIFSQTLIVKIGINYELTQYNNNGFICNFYDETLL